MTKKGHKLKQLYNLVEELRNQDMAWWQIADELNTMGYRPITQKLWDSNSISFFYRKYKQHLEQKKQGEQDSEEQE